MCAAYAHSITSAIVVCDNSEGARLCCEHTYPSPSASVAIPPGEPSALPGIVRVTRGGHITQAKRNRRLKHAHILQRLSPVLLGGDRLPFAARATNVAGRYNICCCPGDPPTRGGAAWGIVLVTCKGVQLVKRSRPGRALCPIVPRTFARRGHGNAPRLPLPAAVLWPDIARRADMAGLSALVASAAASESPRRPPFAASEPRRRIVLVRRKRGALFYLGLSAFWGIDLVRGSPSPGEPLPRRAALRLGLSAVRP